MKRFTVPHEDLLKSNGGNDSSFTLAYVIHDLWVGLTGWAHFGSVKEEEKPFLDIAAVKFLSVTVTLPKASLLGEGVSTTCSQFFKNGPGEKMRENLISASLKIHNLKVPTLVGVNPHERKAKQFVTTSVNVERYFRMDDYYPELEATVVKVSTATCIRLLPLSQNMDNADYLHRRLRSPPTRLSKPSVPIWLRKSSSPIT